MRALSTFVALDVVMALVALGCGGGTDRERADGGMVEAPTATTGAPTTSSAATVPVPDSATTAPTADRPAPARSRKTGAAAPATRSEAPGTLTDPAGDTVVAGTGTRVAEMRADIVSARAAYARDAITFVMQVQRSTDPRHDEGWAGNTAAVWSADTNGDSIADYEIRYVFLDEDYVTASVSRPGADSVAVCGVTSATYGADGYKVTVDPACLGNPASFRYQASMSYDTDPAARDASVARDVAPDKGWSPAVRNNG